MQVWINGTEHELVDGSGVPDVLDVLGAPASGVAVAIDGDVVRRADWPLVRLADGARVEVLTAVQGG